MLPEEVEKYNIIVTKKKNRLFYKGEIFYNLKHVNYIQHGNLFYHSFLHELHLTMTGFYVCHAVYTIFLVLAVTFRIGSIHWMSYGKPALPSHTLEMLMTFLISFNSKTTMLMMQSKEEYRCC